MNLYKDWLEAKEDEREAQDRRRAIEDKLTAELCIENTADGSHTIKDDGYKIKVTTRMNRKINVEELQELAAEHGLTEHLSSLFRWKPDVNVKEWKAAAQEITAPLMAAITTEPGRPSFAIEAPTNTEEYKNV
jgi:hypothetical protein